MPWWSIIYLILFLVVVLAGAWLEARDRNEETLVQVLDSLSVIIVGYLFVSFWVGSLRQPLGLAAPVLFVLATGWQIYDTPRGMRAMLTDPDLSEGEKRWLLIGITAFLLPAFFVAGLAAFK